MSILVYVDHAGGTAKQISWEIMGKARNFADQLGQPLVAVVVGDQTGNLAAEAIRYGADQVLVAEDPEFAQFRAGVYAAALKAAIEQAKAEIVLLSNSFQHARHVCPGRLPAGHRAGGRLPGPAAGRQPATCRPFVPSTRATFWLP